jgi:hypothetical protein
MSITPEVIEAANSAYEDARRLGHADALKAAIIAALAVASGEPLPEKPQYFTVKSVSNA